MAAGADPLDENVGAQDALKQAGQIIVIFALMLTVIIGLVGIAIDTTYAWRESLRVQRAADAASLAGVVYMPGCFDASSPGCGTNNASAIAVAEAKQNGYTASTTTFVTPAKGATPRELDVSITTQSPTFFSRIFGINSWTVTRSSKAVYVTPVPMGSPQAYYGVYALCDAVNTVPNCPNETGPTSVTVTSQGFFGAIEAEGSNTSTGDAFAPYYDGNPTLNPKYNSAGYEYDVTANSAGNLYLFDADFCATSDKKDGSGHAGAGDHWLGANPVGASTYYLLYDTNNTPLTTADDRLVTSKYFTNQLQADESNLYGNGHNYIDGQGNTIPAGTVDCETAAADPYHNAWWQMYGGLQAGHVYRLMVTTTDPSNQTGNLSQNFENMFSIAVSGSGNTIAGNGSMETYANISSGSQQFYLAQIDAQAGAGKTVEIDLFDPGDTSSASWIQIEPDTSSAATAWQPATFAYTSTGSTSPWPSSTSTNCIQTHGGTGTAPSGCTQTSSNSSTFFQDSWVAITISLPTTYGSTPLVNSGWWKIKYIVNLGNDTTTWQVSIRGNPVHLI